MLFSTGSSRKMFLSNSPRDSSKGPTQARMSRVRCCDGCLGACEHGHTFSTENFSKSSTDLSISSSWART